MRSNFRQAGGHSTNERTPTRMYIAALWQALRKALPATRLRGCVFHWAQAVWRKVQALGLSPIYAEKGTVFRCVRSMLALPFLPADLIPQAFQNLSRQNCVRNSANLMILFQYVERTWLNSQVFRCVDWSVHKQPVRTNNDVEGWHNRLNMKARGGSLALYQLIEMLHREARMLQIHQQLLKQKVVLRYQRRSQIYVQGAIASLWDELEAGETSVRQFLRSIGRIYGYGFCI